MVYRVIRVLQRYADQDLATSQLFTDGPEDLTCYRMLSGTYYFECVS